MTDDAVGGKVAYEPFHKCTTYTWRNDENGRWLELEEGNNGVWILSWGGNGGNDKIFKLWEEVHRFLTGLGARFPE